MEFRRSELEDMGWSELSRIGILKYGEVNHWMDSKTRMMASENRKLLTQPLYYIWIIYSQKMGLHKICLTNSTMAQQVVL